MNIKEASLFVGKHSDTIRRAIKSGRLKAIYDGGKWNIKKADILSLFGGGDPLSPGISLDAKVLEILNQRLQKQDEQIARMEEDHRSE